MLVPLSAARGTGVSVPAPPARAGTVLLGQATALVSGCEVSTQLGCLSVTSLIKAAEANYCHMLGTI